MKTLAQNDPLTDAAFHRLGDFLEGCKSGKAMNLEQLDSFFAALIAGLETVMSSEYNREVFGGEKLEFSNVNEAREILSLLMRHWNTIAGTLHKGEPYVPLLLEGENGVAHGNDWARGFVGGMNMRRDGWTELVNDEEHGRCLIPMMMLCHEHDEDPEMRPDSAKEEREVIAGMAAGQLEAHKYFRQQGDASVSSPVPEPRRGTRKVGRNDPCSCGSGKKYKRSCGAATVN